MSTLLEIRLPRQRQPKSLLEFVDGDAVHVRGR